MKNNIFPITPFNRMINKFLNLSLKYDFIYQSADLEKYILKKHPECTEYLQYLPFIIGHPDYIGINLNETGTNFELIKIFDQNIQIEIKLDIKEDYLYAATLHSITDSKLRQGLKNSQ